MGKKIQLSVIKTNAERRRMKEVHDEIGALKRVAQENGVVAYAMVMWDEEGGSAFFNTEALGHASELRAELAKRVLERVENNLDTIQVIDSMVED